MQVVRTEDSLNSRPLRPAQQPPTARLPEQDRIHRDRSMTGFGRLTLAGEPAHLDPKLPSTPQILAPYSSKEKTGRLDG